MNPDEPTYETTADEQAQLGEYLRVALSECVDELKFIEPLILTCVSANGSVLVVRTDGQQVDELAFHREGRGFALPLNIMVTDSRGEATRVLITNEGTTRLN